MLLKVILFFVTLALGLAAPDPSPAPDPDVVARILKRQLEADQPGIGGTIDGQSICGHVGSISGCVGPSGISGALPGISGQIIGLGGSALPTRPPGAPPASTITVGMASGVAKAGAIGNTEGKGSGGKTSSGEISENSVPGESLGGAADVRQRLGVVIAGVVVGGIILGAV